MTHPVLALGVASDLPLLLAAVVPAALVLVLTVWAVRRRTTRTQKRLGGPAVKVAALAALGCTAYSADTSWRFAADYLDMAGTAERIMMFAAAELALFATALMARQNLATQGAPGLPGTLVWVITGVQVIPAFAESGLVGGTVRAFVGPVMAAMLWHLAMGIELRLHTPGAASHGLIAVLGREARERLLSRLGIAARDRDAAQITRDRATARAVTLAAKLADRTPQQQQSRRGRRLTRRLSAAVGRASVGTDPLQRTQLLDQLAARRHALALATVPLPSPWSPEPSTAPATAGPPQPTTNGDRGPSDAKGPASEVETLRAPDRPGTEDGYVGTIVGTTTPEAGAAPGAGPSRSEGTREDTAGMGTDRPMQKVPAQVPDSYRGPTAAESGTEPTGDRGPTTTDTGTEPTGDRGPTTTTDTGTEPTGDRGPTVPLRRKPITKPRTKNKGKRGRSRTPQSQRPPRELEPPEHKLVREVRPHVPGLLARDGNGAITRVQLREIIRREGLTGCRNDRITLVLQELRSEDTTTTRGTT
ncbi:hypothetical protein AB0L83_05255 [Streptomyces sp. NPDC052071]|uniref:hypothetical protein n=1 Tax=Streptomyces TaxID=1883 RepID=UPI0029B7D305|nr:MULTISPECIES: hypothetical protein [unclassified Streptomyces]MDX3180609.1 hypothetical protein [Streptomyces sp. ME02-7008A-1]MDX3301350.1 hypothetical protein [Streptomyces sp. ME02-7008A]